MGRRRAAVLVVTLVGLAGLGWFGRSSLGAGVTATVDAVSGWSTRLRDIGAAEPHTEVALRSREGESVGGLIVLGTAERSAAFALLASNPGGPPLLVVLPQDLLVAVPGFGEHRLIDALVFGGPELAELAVTNQFGIRIDAVAALPAGAIADGVATSVAVDLSVPLFSEAPDGTLTRILPAGPGMITPDLVETLLVEEGSGDEFEWIQRQGSAWRSVLDAVAQAPSVADDITALGGAGAGTIADLLVTVAGDEDSVLATIPVTTAETTLGTDALVPSADQATDFIRTRLGGLLQRPGGRPRVEILNGNGRIGTTADIAAILVRSGFRITRVDNADNFEYEETLVVSQGEGAMDQAREVVDLLGRGLLFLEVRAPSGVVDISIIVGDDIPSGEG